MTSFLQEQHETIEALVEPALKRIQDEDYLTIPQGYECFVRVYDHYYRGYIAEDLFKFTGNVRVDSDGHTFIEISRQRTAYEAGVSLKPPYKARDDSFLTVWHKESDFVLKKDGVIRKFKV